MEVQLDFVKYINVLDLTKPYPKPFKLVHGFVHSRLTKLKSRATNWLAIDSPEFLALVNFMTNACLCNQIKRCKSYIHAGELEYEEQISSKTEKFLYGSPYCIYDACLLGNECTY